ncbi:LacI family DNA-binding transcriptional regulator [Synoicihabitans lomoniglobus]|uniref:LacI family DNA-binding transcriptional regulator n=1 Tax=Synoicihabitans lomoniglobus TaxID=2909285 RepID=A0AAE9ZUR2_9BACT|nr:LacI family transcriptional regulator [Opitutaceae bacterium LMO-M01]WED63160.1 LacI family DNA-binding transcriptional regulator [Opitutaceae bacterium LMO-M01]
MKRRVTQQDIAKELGLDKSTVSLALRNNPGIAKATLERVQGMADKLGYRPDPALSNLARQRWAGHETGSGAALAYLIDSRMANADQHRRFLDPARARAEGRGYLLHEFDLAEYSSMKAASRVLNHRGIRGLLVPQFAHTNGPSLFEMPAANFTVVCLDLGWVSVPFHIVAPDMFENTRRVWREVVNRGYKRIGGAILSHTPQAVDDAARYGASAASQHEFIPKKDRIPLLTTDHADRAGFMKWFERHEPEVVIAFISRVYDWILETGRRVPEDVAVASLSVFPDQTPEVSGVLRQVDNIGITGVDALIAAMHEHEWGIPTLQRKLSLEPIWYEGTSLPSKQV